jgi:hypothetical protein
VHARGALDRRFVVAVDLQVGNVKVIVHIKVNHETCAKLPEAARVHLRAVCLHGQRRLQSPAQVSRTGPAITVDPRSCTTEAGQRLLMSRDVAQCGTCTMADGVVLERGMSDRVMHNSACVQVGQAGLLALRSLIVPAWTGGARSTLYANDALSWHRTNPRSSTMPRSAESLLRLSATSCQ